MHLSRKPGPPQDDDAFATGLRLIGRCIANGAHVSDALRLEVGERLVDFWVNAPSEAREQVGRVLADGFCNIASSKLDAALHHRWLMEDGAGDILSKRKNSELTLSVLQKLLNDDTDRFHMYHSFKHAMRAAGDDALQIIINSMNPEVEDAKAIAEMSRLLWHLDAQSVSPKLALQVARDARLPRQARMRAYGLVKPPLEDSGVALAVEAFKHADWDRNYEGRDLIKLHTDPPAFFELLLRRPSIPIDRKVELAFSIGLHVMDVEVRESLARALIRDEGIETEVRTALRLMMARYGGADHFRSLVADIPSLPMKHVATTIALFGHYPEKALAEEAAKLTRARAKSASEIVQIANSVTTGMRHVFEMDWDFGGLLRAAPPHAGIAPWIELLEDWSDHPDLGTQDRMQVRTAAADLGSEAIASALERDLLAIDDFDGEVWTVNDKLGHTISSALGRIQRRLPALPDEFLERILRSNRYNIASSAVGALSDRGDVISLRRLVDFHRTKPEWMLRDLAANKIELLAARLQIVVLKEADSYRFD